MQNLIKAISLFALQRSGNTSLPPLLPMLPFLLLFIYILRIYARKYKRTGAHDHAFPVRGYSLSLSLCVFLAALLCQFLFITNFSLPAFLSLSFRFILLIIVLLIVIVLPHRLWYRRPYIPGVSFQSRWIRNPIRNFGGAFRDFWKYYVGKI